jgi:hypothetical protein
MLEELKREIWGQSGVIERRIMSYSDPDHDYGRGYELGLRV